MCLEKAVHEFMRPEQLAAVSKACFAFAGNIVQHKGDQTVVLTNQDTEIVYSRNTLSAALQCDVSFVNDFEAVGHYISKLEDAQDRAFKVIQTASGETAENSTAGSLYIGGQTGLGVGILEAQNGRVCTTEGGQTHFAPQNRLESEFCEYCLRTTGRSYIPNDLIASEYGIQLLHNFLVNSEKFLPDVINSNELMKEKFIVILQKVQRKFQPVEVLRGTSFQNALTRSALQGNIDAVIILSLYFAWLGRIAFDMVVIFKPRTLYLTSSIVGRTQKLFSNTQIKDIFLQSFVGSSIMAYIPLNTNVIICYDPLMQLHGCYEAVS